MSVLTDFLVTLLDKADQAKTNGDFCCVMEEIGNYVYEHRGEIDRCASLSDQTAQRLHDAMTLPVVPIGTKTQFGMVVKYGFAYWCVSEGSTQTVAIDAGEIEAEVRDTKPPST